MLFYDCYEKSFLSHSRSLFSHLHRRLICLAISDGVMLTVCCSFPFVVVISTTRASERKREGSIYDRQWEKERKRKNIIVTANPIISLMYVCVDWHVKVFFLRTYTHANRTNQQPKKMLSKRARVCNKKKR